MISVVPQRPEAKAARVVTETRVWGQSARSLHDLCWAARGIQVVRPGQPPDPKGPNVFLLLRSHQGVLMHGARPLLRRLAWSGCPLLSVRVVDRSAARYRERVVTTNEHELKRIDRIYPRLEGRVGRVGITVDPKLAQRWAEQTQDQERWRVLTRGAKSMRRAASVCDGHLFDVDSPRGQTELLQALVQHWREPGRVIPGIYQYKFGVWVHETTRIDPEARLVGPLWIGQVGELHQRKPIVGPLVVSDGRSGEVRVSEVRVSEVRGGEVRGGEVRTHEGREPGPRLVHDSRSIDVKPVEIDWDALRLPSFPLVPKIGRGMSRRTAKRVFDVVMSLGVLAMTLPLYPIVMLLIYLEDGRPFFFGHRRQTLGGKEFPCWKFRTMIKNAEHLKAQLQAQNVCDGPQFFIAKDPRLLKVGWWLRRLQIDELPQFWNVLLGHMSVVGPRPSPDKENQYCPAWREARLSVRPGITGLWQVRRTRLPETDFQEWIRYDLEYVQHQSFRLDAWIIFETVRKIVRG
ncbi:MAG: sugar transferase [Planctomycetota bacterium]|nr:sugar transferase [Planctomycetota bacterium]